MNTIKFYNGVEIPQIGYGAMVAPADTERLVSEALSTGYRMIDTAQSYINETEVGNAVRMSGISRRRGLCDLFAVRERRPAED
jgi:diketogulonate reductase-like aldo/keto reductase